MSIRVLVGEDHTIVRRGLTAMLKLRNDLDIVGEASDGRQAIEMCEKLRPDVVILDVAMPVLNGIDATREILKKLPTSRVVMLSARTDGKTVREGLAAGAKGYVAKDAAVEELGRAIDAVMQGQTFLSEVIARRLASEYLEENDAIGSARPLSPRERQILQLLAEGKATKEAAAAMGVSVKTAETYRRSIMEKLQLYSVAELTKHAIREGLTSIDF